MFFFFILKSPIMPESNDFQRAGCFSDEAHEFERGNITLREYGVGREARGVNLYAKGGVARWTMIPLQSRNH